MAPRIALVLVLMTVLQLPAWAKHKKHHDNGVQMTIEEVNAMQITVDVGAEGKDTYSIAKNAPVTIDGAPASIDDLRGGMTVKLTMGADNETVEKLDAGNPPKVTANPKKSREPVIINLK